MRSVNHWARCLVLGNTHKCLRVLTVSHFVGALLNPGLGYIPDLTRFLPYDRQWFLDGLDEVDYRTTDKCVKNGSNSYKPIWLPNGSTIRAEIVKFIAKRIEIGNQPQQPPQPNAGNGDESFDDDIGPNFGAMQDLPAVNQHGGAQPSDRALAPLVQYESHHRCYVSEVVLCDSFLCQLMRSTTTFETTRN